MSDSLKKYIGRDYEKYNCLDLVKEFYLDFFGLTIKEYYEGGTPDRREVESLINTNRGDFERVDDSGERKFGDLIVIKLYGIECHIGVYIENGMFLHSGRTVGSHIDRVSKYEHLVAGFYRHREIPA